MDYFTSDYIQSVENKFESFLIDYEEKNFEVMLYGAGNGLGGAINLLRTYGINPKCIVDKNKSKHGKEYLNVPIVSLDNVLKNYSLAEFAILISAPKFEKEITQELQKIIEKDRIYSFECELYYSFLPDIDEYRKYLIENIENFKYLYSELEDDLSKKTLKNIIKGRLTGELRYFNEICVPNQYFCKDIVKLSKKELILDVGASHGDTLKEIKEITNGQFEHIYCLEPDKECFKKLNTTKDELGLCNVSTLNKGAWDITTKLSFLSDQGQGSSKVVETQEKTSYEESLYTIETVSLDEIIKEPVSFIKMDIEGAELNALKGSKNIIKKYKPKLAICVYHKKEDFIEIFKYIKNLSPDYKIYLRHHQPSGTDTVMYAIP